METGEKRYSRILIGKLYRENGKCVLRTVMDVNHELSGRIPDTMRTDGEEVIAAVKEHLDADGEPDRYEVLAIHSLSDVMKAEHVMRRVEQRDRGLQRIGSSMASFLSNHFPRLVGRSVLN